MLYQPRIGGEGKGLRIREISELQVLIIGLQKIFA